MNSNSLLRTPFQRRLLKKWGPIIESGPRIESEDKKLVLAQLLENTRKYFVKTRMLTEAGTNNWATHQNQVVNPGGPEKGYAPGQGVLHGDDAWPYTKPPGNPGDYYLPNIVMPMLRRIMPNLIANDLVSVQPLNGPLGYAVAYRPLYGENGGLVHNKGYSAGKEIFFHPTDTRYSGQTTKKKNVETDMSKEDSETILEGISGYDDLKEGDGVRDYWKAYAGTDDTDSPFRGVGVDLGDSEFVNIHGGGPGSENDNYPQVSFGLVKSAVEAKTRKLAAHWSPELAEDMQAMHGIDVEREMVNTLTYEIGAEIDRQLITEMVKAAILGRSVAQWSPAMADGLDQMGRLATLLTQITIEANQIAIRTRRGNANFVITTPRICALLQQLSMNKFTTFKQGGMDIPTVPDSGVGALAKIGLINSDQQLLVRDSYAAGYDQDYLLMGYKGKQHGDSGIIYCPYIPLQLSKVLQPGTFTPSIGCRTRYGILNSPWDAKNFYTFMRIYGLTDTYVWGGPRQFTTRVSPITTGTVITPNGPAPKAPPIPYPGTEGGETGGGPSST